MTTDSEQRAGTGSARRGVALLVAVTLVGALFSGSGCKSSGNQPPSPDNSRESSSSSEKSGADDEQTRVQGGKYRDDRLRMVRTQIADRGIDDSNVLAAMRKVPRHRFIPNQYRERAYADTPLPIGHDQTISQPYIVAAMSQALKVSDEHKVLEIGTGSGYQAAILGELAGEVYSIEIVCDLAKQARKQLEAQGYNNIHVRCGDGYKGWPDQAPFDRIIVTAAPPEIPQALVDQLATGGRMVLPVGDRVQKLKVIRKKPDGSIEKLELMDVRFVPMVHGEDAGG